jgi:predicted kinase
MKEAIITVGISASGKSWWATEFCGNSPGFYIINRDDIREKILFEKTGEEFAWGKWKWKWEDEVTNLQWQFIKECAKSPDVLGIIISDTNLNQKRNDSLIEKLTEEGFNVSFKFFKIDVAVAIERDKMRGNRSVGKNVILKQFEQFKML